MIYSIINSLFVFRRYRNGVTSIEYALLASVITVAMYPWLYIIGAEVATPFWVIYDTIAHIDPY